MKSTQIVALITGHDTSDMNLEVNSSGEFSHNVIIVNAWRWL